MRKVAFCVPTVSKPYRACLDSIAASIPLIDAAGWDHYMISHIGCPYISAARATMLRKSLDAKVDVIVFIDHDVSWDAGDLLKLIETDGDYVVGTYRFKKDEEEYMGQLLSDDEGKPIVRTDGALKTFSAPAGFMKITPKTVNLMTEHYPELCYGDRHTPHFDFFNHGAHKHVWYGEDYAACRRWLEIGQDIWTIPDMNIVHNGDKPYPGNLHQFLMKQQLSLTSRAA